MRTSALGIFSALGFAALVPALSAGMAACTSDAGPGAADYPEAGSDAPRVDAAPEPRDASATPDAHDAAAPTDAGTEAAPKDTTPPGAVTDLAATTTTSSEATLTWSAPTDESGKAAAYDVRFAKTAITSEAEFLAATAATSVPTPGAAGAPETLTVTKLDEDSDYHFVVRARDAANNWGDLSNDATLHTKPRAAFLVSEVAVDNGGDATSGFDFVEIVATKAGTAEGIEIKQLTTTLYKLGVLDVAVGDRFVIHATGVPGPTGFAQEDVTKDKTSSTDPFASSDAYDVYSTTNGLVGTDNLIAVEDGATSTDAVALSDRGGTIAAATMTAFAAAKTAGAWNFTAAPVDGVNDCDTARDAVNTSTADADTACGGFKSIFAAGVSLNRSGLNDTNTKADFYLAPQTRGAANAPPPVPTTLVATATSATTVDLAFDQEIAPGSVTAASFTASNGLTVNAASAAVNHVTLTTTAQVDGAYDLTIANTVTSLQGVTPSPLSARFCGYATMPAALTLTEVSPNLASALDLIELTVTRGGPLTGFTLRSNPGGSAALLATLPAICSATGDVVVVHLSPTANAVDPADSETTAKDQFASATYAQNYDGAWDVRGGNSGIVATSVVLGIRDPRSIYVEAVPFSKAGITPSADAVKSLVFVQGEGLWLPPTCAGGVACTDATMPSVSAIWDGVGTTPAASSVRRTAGAATTDATSWSVGPSSFGAAN